MQWQKLEQTVLQTLQNWLKLVWEICRDAETVNCRTTGSVTCINVGFHVPATYTNETNNFCVAAAYIEVDW